jgi:hypothetical protein
MQASLRESRSLPGARQRQENARQSLCRAFFVRAHDKECTTDFCTVKSHCRAPSLTTHGELSLPCVAGRRTAKKQLTTPVANDVKWHLPCASLKTHGKDWNFVVRQLENARQRSYCGQQFLSLCRAHAQKRTTKCPLHFFCFARIKITKNHMHNMHSIIFITVITYIIIFITGSYIL